MATRAPDEFYTQGFNYVKNGTHMHLCSAEPANHSQVAGLSLGSVAVAGGDFSEGAGAPNGRKLTVASKTVAGTASGTANHAVIVNASDSTIRYIVSMLGVQMANGVNQQVASWSITIEAPTTV